MAGRRVALYFAWSRPAEIGADFGVLENRYPTLYEFRRALWPEFESLKQAPPFLQDISGFLDHVVLHDFQRFANLIKEVTGNEVPISSQKEERPGDVPIYISDCGRLYSRTSWRPRRQPAEILRDLHDWIVANEEQVTAALGLGTGAGTGRTKSG